VNSITLHNAQVITPQGILEHGTVQIDQGKITSVSPGDPDQFSDIAIDAQGMYLAPGFIDLHVHGGDGADFMDNTLEAFETITRFYGTRGVTALQPTTTAAPPEDLILVLETARVWKQKAHRTGSRLLGVHVEGPFLNIEQTGAQPPRNLRDPSIADLDRLLQYADVITQLTLAPELPGALELIREASQRGILVSAGHSQAREKEILAAIEAGLRHTIHIYSSMSTVVREGPWRVPGLLETTLVYDELTTEMIADLKHIPPTLMRLVFKCKGLDSLCLVSDAMRGAGKAEGETLLFGDQEILIEDGVAMLPDRTAFAGSITPLDTMVRNVIETLGLSVEQAVQMATRNPARVLGIEAQKGSIEPGKDADLVIFDDQIQVQTTIVGGEIVYSSE
jgi:N-acetylglucosamine-6-phosphate deacetylase